MKHFFSFSLALLALPGLMRAQWTTPDVNTIVRAAEGNDATTPLIAEGPDGSTYVSWFENADGAYQLRMQRLAADGTREWDDAGLIVSAHPQNSAIFRYDLKADLEGNAIVAFQDERTGALDIVAYKIGPDGSFLWGADGIELPTPGTTGLAPVIGVLSNNDAVIAWNADGSPDFIALQKVGADGTAAWGSPMTITDASPLARPKVIASGTGFIVQYVRQGATFLAPGTMYAMRYADDATPVWAGPVVVSTKTIAGFFFPEPVSDGHDGFYLAFNTSNPVSNTLTDVYAQRVRDDGTTWSAEGTRLDDSNTTQKFTAGKALALISDANGLMVPLQVTNTAQSQSGVSVQRLDINGALQLGTTAVTVLPVSATAVYPSDITPVADGAVILHTTGDFGQVHLAATRVDLSGGAVWTPAQLDLSTVNSNKDDVQVTAVRNEQAVAVWQDDRTISGLYAQRIAGLDVTTGVVAHANDSGIRLETNPSSMPVLLAAAPIPAGTDIRVCDAQGRMVLQRTVTAQQQRILLPISGLAEGLYTVTVADPVHPTVLRWVNR